MKFTCPVCYYPFLDEPPADFEICPACGTEFDYDDAAPTMRAKEERRAMLRRKWLDSGAPWFDPTTPRPMGWNFHVQLLKDRALLPELIKFSTESSSNVKEVSTRGVERRVSQCHVL